MLDLSSLSPEEQDLILQELRDGIYMDQVLYEKKQRAVHELGLMNRVPNRKVGTVVASMDAGLYYYWEQVAGKGCWADKSERESILKFAPAMRCRQEKLMDRVGFDRKFGAGWERLAVDGKPTTREERMSVSCGN